MPETKAVMTEAEAVVANQLLPGHQNILVGDRLKETQGSCPHIQKVVVSADATGGFSFVVKWSGEITDLKVQCTASNTSGTLKLRRATTDITDAIVCAVVDVETRAATVVQAQKVLTQGETLNVIANGASDRGVMYINILRS